MYIYVYINKIYLLDSYNKERFYNWVVIVMGEVISQGNYGNMARLSLVYKLCSEDNQYQLIYCT